MQQRRSSKREDARRVRLRAKEEAAMGQKEKREPHSLLLGCRGDILVHVRHEVAQDGGGLASVERASGESSQNEANKSRSDKAKYE